MKPTEVKLEIVRIKKNMILEDSLVRIQMRYMDEDNFKERVSKQEKIIAEAAASIRKIRHQRKNAILEIGKIEQHMRWEKRRLVVLNNFENIERLKSMADKIETMSKEMIKHGEEHSNP